MNCKPVSAVPRTIAQKLVVLSSQAKVAGHRGVLEAILSSLAAAWSGLRLSAPPKLWDPWRPAASMSTHG
eukprot:s6910_g1.t1